MTNTFTVASQQLVIDPPEPSKGLPISHHEWLTLKSKVKTFQKNKSFINSFGWKDFGMLFLGVALATFVSLWVPGYISFNSKIIAWAVIGVCSLIGFCMIFFQYQLDKNFNDKDAVTATNILEIMELIEINRAAPNNQG